MTSAAARLSENAETWTRRTAHCVA
jgi:hypothetical protein